MTTNVLRQPPADTRIAAGTGIADNICALIGNTPMLRLGSPTQAGVAVYAKLEKFNPLSSTKDRIALAMLDGAERRGELVPGGTVIEATSGNTGIALAALAAARGYACTIVMPDSASVERIQILRAFGAQVELTPAADGYQAAIDRAMQIRGATAGGWFACQHDNQDNVRAHYLTTGPEIWRDLDGRVDVLVCGIGTGGTITGTGRYLREQNPDLEIVGVEPLSSPVITQGRGAPHRIPGWNGGFVAPTTDVELLDRVLVVSDDDALARTRELMRRHGLFVGISSGGAYHAASQVAEANPSKTVVTLFPDTGDRYLSLFSADDSARSTQPRK